MPNLSTFLNKYGPKEGLKQYNAWHREYKRKNRVKINARRRMLYKASKIRAK